MRNTARNDIAVMNGRYFILAKQSAAVLRQVLSSGGRAKTYYSLERRTKVNLPSLYSIVSRLKAAGLVTSSVDGDNVTRISPTLGLLHDGSLIKAKVIY